MSTAFRLGRGLGSLIPSRSAQESASATHASVQRIPLSQLHVNPRQPRSPIERGTVDDLVASIREHGILQPLIVRPTREGYVLIAGERRFQAAKILGLKTVPVVVREATEQQQLELALVENLQRKDLNPLEEAEAFQQLIDDFNCTQERVAKRVGKSRSHVANTLRLRSLPTEIKDAILKGTITEGHAKVLLSLDTSAEQIALFKRIVAHGLSVRAGETIVKSRRKTASPRTRATDPDLRAQEEALKRALGTKVSIERTGGRGTIHIDFYSREELAALIQQLTSHT